MSRRSVLAVVLAALLQSLPQTAVGEESPSPRGSRSSVPAPIKAIRPIDTGALTADSMKKLTERVDARIRAHAPVAAATPEKTQEESELEKQRTWIEKYVNSKIEDVKKLIAERNAEAVETSSNDEEDSSSRALRHKTGYVDLNLEKSRKALGGDTFGVFAKSGQLYLRYMTSEECGEELLTQVKGSNFKLRLDGSCMQPEGELHLFEEPLGIAIPSQTTSICLLSDRIHEKEYQIGQETQQCDEVFKVVSKEDAEKAALLAKRAEIADELQGILETCGESNALSDKLVALSALESAGSVLGKESAEAEMNRLRTAIAKRSLTDAAAIRISGLDQLEKDVLPILRNGTEEHQLAAFKFKKNALQNRIFSDSTKSLAEKREAYEEALAQLEEEAIDLNAEEEKVTAIVESFKNASTAKFAELDREEKVGQAMAEVPAAKEGLMRAMTSLNPMEYQQALLNYQTTLNKHGKSLGCFTVGATPSNECKSLSSLAGEVGLINQSRSQLLTRNSLVQQCQGSRATDPNAKCEALVKHEQEMAKNPFFGGTPNQQQTVAGAPALTLPTFPGSTPQQTQSGFDITQMGGTDMQFFQYSHDAAKTGVNPSQNPQNSVVAPQVQAPPQPAPVVPARTLSRRG